MPQRTRLSRNPLALVSGACVCATSFALAPIATAQEASPPPAASASAPAATPAPSANPMSMPAMSVTLSANPAPYAFDAGPIGKIYVTGALTGLALTQNHVDPGDHQSWGDISNAQVFVQKTDGPLQFFLQVGAYSLPSLGTPYVKAISLTQDTYGVVPQAYVKFAPTSSFNIIIGKLPTLLGAETTFTFENTDIERGLLWNQENVVNRGIQANYTKGPITVSVSLNDGYYSNRYDWVSGLITYTLNPRDSVTVAAGGNFDRSTVSTFATPFYQNNGEVYDLILTHTQGALSITPYVQYTYIPAAPQIGIQNNASTTGGALLAKYNVTPAFSLAARGEYISSRSGAGQINLLYGPGSAAWSLTVTPTYQFKVLFLRAELSYTRATSFTPGFGFGPAFGDKSQVRGLIETGALF